MQASKSTTTTTTTTSKLSLQFPIADLYRMGHKEGALYAEQQEKAKGPYKGEEGSVNTEEWLSKFITVELDELKNEVRALAFRQTPILILGPTGVGKEIIARALHGSRGGPWIGINCTSLPDYLLESELFGHAQGSFTGAIKEKRGLLSEASEGTVFLDEIGDMPLQLQAKLLRVLQDYKIRKVGSNTEESISCRFILATNQNLDRLIAEKKFREDLYYRISTFELHIPGLKDRLGDIAAILTSLGAPKDFPIDRVLQENPQLDGNVRELQRRVERFKVFGRV